MPDITVEVTQSDITANVTSPNITATVTSADITANVTTADVTANVEAANVTVNITGGGSPHIIQDEGVAETQRANLNFVGASVDVTDDSVNNATIVTITGGATAWGDITGTLEDQTDLQSALDGKSDTGHTHPLSDLTQSGATLNQIPKWNGSAWVPADDETGGGGGGASYTEITYADMVTAIAGSTLTPGGWYLITDAAGTDLGFLTYAVNENTINVAGTGGYLNADFQAVGDYSGTPVAFNAQLGIWRTGFETVTINYLNLAGGTFAVGDTITGGTTGATAVIVTDDGASSMTAYMTSAGVAFDGSEVLSNGTGVTADQDGAATSPTIVQGDVVIWNLLHWQLTDATLLDGTGPATNTAAYTQLTKATANVGYITAWDVSEFDFANAWLQYRQDLRGNEISYSYRDKLFFENSLSVISAFPFGWNGAYINKIEHSFVDIRNCLGRFYENLITSDSFIINFYSGIGSDFAKNYFIGSAVQNVNMGNQNRITSNHMEQSSFSGITFTGENSGLQANNLIAGATIQDIVFFGNNSMEQNTLYAQSGIINTYLGNLSIIQNNILENGASLTGITAGANCSISRNKIGQGATLGGSTTMYDSSTLDGNVLGSGASLGTLTIGVTGGASCDFNLLDPDAAMTGITVESGGNASGNKLGASANVNTLTLGTSTAFNANVIAGGGTVTDITAGAGCSISRNDVGIGATLGGATTMGDGAAFSDLDIRANKQIANKTLDAAVTFSDKVVQITADTTETLSANVDGNRTQPGFSDIPGTIDITGLTTLDCTAAWAQYRGIYNLTSTNATEAIDTITNPPTLFPFTLRPAAGLTLTVTGTAYAGIAAGQIALKNASYVLDGAKGEYIVLEIDPLGTGCLVEKQVVNGII